MLRGVSTFGKVFIELVRLIAWGIARMFTAKERALIRKAMENPEKRGDLLRTILAESPRKTPAMKGEAWDKFLREEVPNPNPKTREKRPTIKRKTLYEKPEYQQHIKDEWAGHHNPELKRKQDEKKQDKKEETRSFKKKYHPHVESIMEKHSLTDEDASQVKGFGKKNSGVQYSKEVQALITKHGLSAEELKQVLAFKEDKPADGVPHTDKMLQEKALSHSAIKDPALKKKIQSMSADEFGKLHKAVSRGGRKQTDAQLFEKFKEHAKPETKKRMEKMTPAEFVKMLGAILKDEDEKTASLIVGLAKVAAMHPETEDDILKLFK